MLPSVVMGCADVICHPHERDPSEWYWAFTLTRLACKFIARRQRWPNIGNAEGTKQFSFARTWVTICNWLATTKWPCVTFWLGGKLVKYQGKVNILILKVKLATKVEGYPGAPFSIATTPRCREGRYSFPWISPICPWSLPYNAEC